MSDEILSSIVSQIRQLSDGVAEIGSGLVMVPIPRKAVLCADRLPRWCRTQARVDSAFVAMLKREGVQCVDLAKALRASSAAPFYYQRGSHWTHDCQIIAAQEACRVAGILSDPGDRTARIIPIGPRPQQHDVLVLGGLEPAGFIQRYLARTTSPHYRVRGRAPSSGGAGAALFGTSFSVGSFQGFLRSLSRVPVEIHAGRGESPFTKLLRYFSREGSPANTGRLPKVTIFELPVHFPFEWDDRQTPSLFA